MKNKILIVDDQAENLIMLSEALKDEYAVFAVNSGQKALKFMDENEHPDIILLDIIMPDINGFEVCTKLKQNPKTSSVPVIFVTIMGEIEDIKKGFEAGGVDYITKPYHIEEVKARIKTHIRIVNQRRELGRVVDELQTSQVLNIEQARIGASSELLKSLAHHWRQPLTVAMIAADNISEGLAAEQEAGEIGGQIKLLKESLKKISTMISEFSLLFSTRDGVELFSIKDAVDKAMRFMSATIEVENIKVDIEIVEDCTIKGHKNEYIHVLLMILSNAIEVLSMRHIKEKHIWITLNKSTDKSSTLSIRDNGGGIDESILRRIFEPYISTKFPSFGVGLNLFTAKILIEKQMGGVLKAENTTEGAMFTIDI